MDSSRPRLVYVVHSLNPGGTERLVVEMGLAVREEFELLVLCLDEPGAWARSLREAGVPVYGLARQPGLDLGLAARIARHCRAFGADIVHAHQCTPWFYSALARLLHGRPRLLLEEHGRFYPETDSRKRRCVNRLLTCPLTHRFVAVSKDVGTRLARYEGVEAQAIEVVYNGTRGDRTMSLEERAALRRSLGFASEDFVIGTVGRFDAIKNLPLLIRSLARITGDVPHVRGLLVGDGPEFDRVRALVAEAGLAGSVRLTGFRQDAAALTRCMDLFVLPSFSEGTSLALLEAMAARVAVAVTAVGGNPEVVESGVTGWVVPSDSLDAMTSALREAALDPDKRTRYAAAGEARFRERFSFDGMMQRYVAIYRELLRQLPERQAA